MIGVVAGILIVCSAVQVVASVLFGRAARRYRHMAAAHAASKARYDVFVGTSRERAALVAEALRLQQSAYALMRVGRTAEAVVAWDKGQALVSSAIARCEHDEAKYADMDAVVNAALSKLTGG